MSIVRALVLVFAAAWLSGCATTLTPAAYRTFDAESASEGELDFHGLPLQSGQLVVSDSGEADSLLMSMFGEEYTPYGHAGILSIEDGKAYVYEGYALLWPFLGGPPTDAMRGRIRASHSSSTSSDSGSRRFSILEPASTKPLSRTLPARGTKTARSSIRISTGAITRDFTAPSFAALA
jgi:hypothetical protein